MVDFRYIVDVAEYGVAEGWSTFGGVQPSHRQCTAGSMWSFGSGRYIWPHLRPWNLPSVRIAFGSGSNLFVWCASWAHLKFTQLIGVPECFAQMHLMHIWSIHQILRLFVARDAAKWVFYRRQPAHGIRFVIVSVSLSGDDAFPILSDKCVLRVYHNMLLFNENSTKDSTRHWLKS